MKSKTFKIGEYALGGIVHVSIGKLDNDIPVLENGVHYELSEIESAKHMLYYCPECNAYHVKDEFLDSFNEFIKQIYGT